MINVKSTCNIGAWSQKSRRHVPEDKVSSFRFTYLRQRHLFLPCFLGCVAFARALVAGAHDQPWSSPHTTKKTAKQRAGTTKDRQRTQLDAAKARKRPTHLFKQSKTFLATLFLTYICVRLWLLFTHSSYGRRRHTRSPKEIGILNPHP